MSEGLKERFINALAATIQLFEETGQEHAKRIEHLEDTNKRLQGEIHELTFEVGRLRQDVKDHARWYEEMIKELDALKTKQL